MLPGFKVFSRLGPLLGLYKVIEAIVILPRCLLTWVVGGSIVHSDALFEGGTIVRIGSPSKGGLICPEGGTRYVLMKVWWCMPVKNWMCCQHHQTFAGDILSPITQTQLSLDFSD